MALATQCPHCGTTFRVAQDQLKLRAGLVRCGACKQVFNGVEHLLRPGTEKPANAPIFTAASTSPSTDAPSPAPVSDAGSAVADSALELPDDGEQADFSDDDAADAAGISAIPPASTDVASDAYYEHTTYVAVETSFDTAPGGALPRQSKSPEPDQDDPLQRMTLMDFTDPDDEANLEAFGDTRIAASDDRDQYGAGVKNPIGYTAMAADNDEEEDALSRAIDNLQSKPWHDKGKRGWRTRPKEADIDEDESEPDFVRRARRQQRLGRPLRMLAGIAIFFLLLGAVLQGVYAFRDQIAARFPQAMPALAQLCTVLDCHVGLPMQIDTLSIESSELQAVQPAQNTFALIALLRNRSNTAQAWPHIELTLNDANEQAIARRIFSPRDYLPSRQEPSKGLGADSEQAVKVSFELSQLKASGYRVYLFYP